MILIKVQMLTCLTVKADDLCTVTGQKAKHLCYQKGRSQNLLPLLAIGIDLYFLRNSLYVFLLQRQISTRNGSDKTLYKVCVCVGGKWSLPWDTDLKDRLEEEEIEKIVIVWHWVAGQLGLARSQRILKGLEGAFRLTQWVNSLSLKSWLALFTFC